LTGLQKEFRIDRRRKPRSFAWVVVICLFLVTLLAVVQVAHMHPFDKDADHCPLCIALQTAAPVAIVATIVVMVKVSTPAPVYVVRAVVENRQFSLFTRPPPLG